MISRRRFLAATALVAAFPSTVFSTNRSVLRLGLVADSQYADRDPQGTRFYRQSIPKLTEAVVRFNSQELDFCVTLGDLIDKHWKSFEEILKPLARSRHTVHHLLGNHDFDVLDGFKTRVPERLGLRRRYYRVPANGFCFIMLDTTEVSPYAHPETSKEVAAATAELRRLAATGAINAHPWNGAVGDKQMKWFEDTCRKAAKAKQKVIVFAHHPVFPASNHNEWNSDSLLEVVKRNRNIVAWINGHNHAGAFGMHDDVAFVTLMGMVETENSNAYAIAELLSDRMMLTGFGREKSRELVFRKG